MKIDNVSQLLIILALWLDEKKGDVLSSIWLGDETLKSLKQKFPHEEDVPKLLLEIKSLITREPDCRRAHYLGELVSSLEFQCHLLKGGTCSISEFYEQTFKYPIQRVSNQELEFLEDEIKKTEKEFGFTRWDEPCTTIDQFSKNIFLQKLEENCSNVQDSLPFKVENGSFSYEWVFQKPWRAFNRHNKPYHSHIMINADYPVTQFDLDHLVFHEGFGGHHTELNCKDLLLLNEGRGEHGLWINYSSQAFVSEGIAEFSYEMFGLKIRKNPIGKLHYLWYRLENALGNYACFLHHEDGLRREEIKQLLKKYSIKPGVIQSWLDFVTDAKYGKYAAVYHSAYNAVAKSFHRAKDKKQWLYTTYNQPTTPSLL